MSQSPNTANAASVRGASPTATVVSPPLKMDRRARDASLAALAHAGKLGLAITVVVVDSSGALVTALRMDGAPWFTPEIAWTKARTAVAFGADSADLEDWRLTRPQLLEQIGSQLAFVPATMPGGLVIRDHDEIVAAIGVSGAQPDQDVECARKGAAAFGADSLPVR